MVLACGQQDFYKENLHVSSQNMLSTSNAVSIVPSVPGAAAISDEVFNNDLDRIQSNKIVDYPISDAVPSFSSLLTRLPHQGE